MPNSGSSGSNFDKLDAVLRAVKGADITKYEAWSELEKLSSHTHVDEIEVDPAGVTIRDGGKFRGIFNVYVALHYSVPNREELVTSDALEGSFEGHFDGNRALVDDMKVNTRPFYE